MALIIFNVHCRKILKKSEISMICLRKPNRKNKLENVSIFFLNKDSSFGIRKGLNSNEGSNRWKKNPKSNKCIKKSYIYLKSDALQLEAKTKRKIHPRYLEYEYN